jgi:hypothetical protein
MSDSDYNQTDSIHNPEMESQDSSSFLSMRGNHKSTDPNFNANLQVKVWRTLALGVLEIFGREGQLIMLPRESFEKLVRYRLQCDQVHLIGKGKSSAPKPMPNQPPVADGGCMCGSKPKAVKRPSSGGSNRNTNVMELNYIRVCKNGKWGIAIDMDPSFRDWFLELGITPDKVRITNQPSTLAHKNIDKKKKK